MAAINPIPDVLAWAIARLNGDEQIVAEIPALSGDNPARVWEGQIPQQDAEPGTDEFGNDPRYPCIILDLVHCPPVKAKRAGNKTIAWQPLLQIRAIDQTPDVQTLAPLAGRISALFDEWRGHETHGLIVVSGSDCTPLVSPPDESEGTIYRYLGCEAQLFVYAAP